MAYCQKSIHSKVNKTMMNRNKMISLLTATSKPYTYVFVFCISTFSGGYLQVYVNFVTLIMTIH